MATYKGSLRRFEVLSKFVLFLISVTLSMFLILLGGKILDDFDSWIQAPNYKDFQDKAALSRVDAGLKAIDAQIRDYREQKYRLQKSREIASRKYFSEKEVFENWLQTRKAIGSPGQNSEVLSRARRLDETKKIEEEWQQKLDKLEENFYEVNKKKETLDREKERIDREDNKKYQSAMMAYSLKLFLVRLLFIAPILAIGVFLFIRYRSSRYKPLVWGYILFSLYAFFVGLVPYLPSYGGYIRYTVGIILTVLLGYYIIKQLMIYTEKKKAELQESNQERAKKIQQQTAIKAYASHCCPSCEVDFLMNKWHPQTKVLKDVVMEDDAPDYCTQCGLQLFGKCRTCGHRNFVHFPFCSSCGAPLQQGSD